MSSVKTAYCEYLQTEHGAKVYNDFKQLLYSDQDTLVEVLDRKIVEPLSLLARRNLKVCDIGGGDGRRITSILRHIHNQHSTNFDLDFVEQSPIYANVFNERPVGAFCKTVIHDSHFEEIQLPQNAYDLVFLIHSIFAFDNGNAIDRVLSLRKREGKVIVVINAPDSFLGGLKKLIDVGFSDHRYELDDLESSLTYRGIPYQKLGFTTNFSLYADCEGQDILTLLEWISLGRFANFPIEQKNAIYSYIDDQSKPVGDRIAFSEAEVALVIPDVEENG